MRAIMCARRRVSGISQQSIDPRKEPGQTWCRIWWKYGGLNMPSSFDIVSDRA